jgi:NitT/TauT family transport system substrate-binding protein
MFTITVVVVALSACNSAQQSPSAIARVKPEVNIGRLICGGHLPLAVVEKMYQNDLKTFRLRTIQNHDWNNVVNDLKSGKLDGTFILSPLAMEMIRDGLPAKIVLKADRNGNGFILSEKVKSIASLNHMKAIIAVPHIYSQHHVLLHMVLKQNNVPKENITVVGMPPRDMINSLRRGEIDGFVVGEPEANKSVTLKVGWMAAISPYIWKDHLDHVLLATDKFIDEHPEQLQELITNLVRAGQFIEANPQEAAIMGEDYTGSPAAVFEKVLTTPPEWIDYSDMIPSEEDIKAMSEKLMDMGLWEKMPEDVMRFTDTRFIQHATQ